MTVLEIAVQDIPGTVAARDFGADRVELCAALGLTGGLTPTIGTIKAAVAVGIPVHVLIRNRPGGFVYTECEVDLMCADIREAVLAGAAGVVIGALKEDRSVALAATETMIRAAREASSETGQPVEITFHRAIDVCPNPVEQLRELAVLGVDRVLTSGGAAKAGDGVSNLKAMVIANTGVQIMAGGGVAIDAIPELVAAGVDAVHLSAKSIRPDVGPTGPGGGLGTGIEFTDINVIRAAVTALKA